jgi:hypothetical protein
MTPGSGPFDYQQVVAETCIRLGVPFDRRPGILLIPRNRVELVLHDVMEDGYEVLGFEGFERDGPLIRPRIDLIYDRDRAPGAAFDALAQFGDETWVDIVLGPPRDIRER